MGSHHVESNTKKTKNNYLLIGNPNVGKSTIFNHVTSSVNDIGNFNRTTVTAKYGKIKKTKFTLVDLPGIYGLNSTNDDEKVAINTILNYGYDGFVNVVNATTFRRDMMLTIQLLETEKNMLVNINMIDELNKKRIDNVKLSKSLKCNINLTVARKGFGIKNIKQELECPVKGFKLNYGKDVEKQIKELEDLITIDCFSKRFIAIQLLEGNTNAYAYLIKNNQKMGQIDKLLNIEYDYNEKIIKARNAFIDRIYLNTFMFDEVVTYNENTLAKKVDVILLEKYFGIPIFFLSLALVYFITFGPYLGGFLQDSLDSFLNDYLLEAIKTQMTQTHIYWWITSFICDGFIKAIFGVLPFFVYILILFFFVGLFQQSGYMSRISVIMDRFMFRFGLNGRNIIALISGMGCNVPTIMMARGNANKREKLSSIFIAPFISCSARSTVFAFVAGLIFTSNVWLVVFSFQIISGIFALFVGLVFSKIMFRRSKYSIVSEIPKWRKPDPKSIMKLMWFECKTFFNRVVKFVMVGSIGLWFLIHIGPTGFLTDDEINKSFIFYVSDFISPIFYPMGLDDKRIITALMLAFPAKELAISNMLIVFNGGGMISTYFTFARAMSYMVFFLLYIPCISTMATMKKETNWKMLIINCSVSLLVAWVAAAITYQVCMI